MPKGISDPVATTRTPPTARLWFVVGGAFLLAPGAVVLYWANLPAAIEFGWADPSTAPLWMAGVLLVILPAALLVAAGSVAIAFGPRRRASVRS